MRHVAVSVSAGLPESFGWANKFARLAAWLRLVLTISAERRQLAKLSDRELDDIGITWAQARAESERASFDVPSSRLPK